MDCSAACFIILLYFLLISPACCHLYFLGDIFLSFLLVPFVHLFVLLTPHFIHFFYVSYSFLEIGSGVAESGLQQKSWPDESCLRVHNVFYKADLDAHSAHQMRSLSPTTPTLCAYAAMIHLRSSPTNATTARGTPFLLATVRERSCVCVLGVHGAVCAGSCVCLCVRGWSNKRAPLSS